MSLFGRSNETVELKGRAAAGQVFTFAFEVTTGSGNTLPDNPIIGTIRVVLRGQGFNISRSVDVRIPGPPPAPIQLDVRGPPGTRETVRITIQKTVERLSLLVNVRTSVTAAPPEPLPPAPPGIPGIDPGNPFGPIGSPDPAPPAIPPDEPIGLPGIFVPGVPIPGDDAPPPGVDV